MPGLPLEAPSGQGSAPTASRGTKPWRDYSFNVVAGPFQTVCLLYTSFAKGELPHGYCISSGGDKVHTNDQWVCKYISSRHGSNHAATLHLKVDIGTNARKQCQVDCYLLGNEKCLIIKNCTIRVRSTQSTQSSPLRLCYHSCEESRRHSQQQCSPPLLPTHSKETNFPLIPFAWTQIWAEKAEWLIQVGMYYCFA